jgi:peptidoglycan/xylan/chitin deacetylase (PgdA/CDA1 family)
VPIDIFKDAMGYLKDRYTLIRYSELHEHRMKGLDLPPRALHISFDDGYQECFSVVRPILLELDIPCTFFITTDFIDDHKLFYRNIISLCIESFNRKSAQEKSRVLFDLNQAHNIALEDATSFTNWIRALRPEHEEYLEKTCFILGMNLDLLRKDLRIFMNREQILDLFEDGFTIGAHTKTHRKLGLMPDEEIEKEIVDSCHCIQDITNQDIVPFSFPHSAWGVDRKLLAELRSMYPLIGLLFDTKGLRQDVNYIVNRVWAERPISLNTGVSSIHQTIRAAYREQCVHAIMEWGRRCYKRKSSR